MKTFICTPERQNPMRVFGLLPYYDGEGFSKCHRAILEQIPRIAGLGARSCGGRICFRTNTKKLVLRMTLAHVCYDIGISTYGCSSADVYIGMRPNAKFVGLLNPPGDKREQSDVTAERIFYLNGDWQDVTIVLPRNETVTAFAVEIDDDAEIAEPTPYRNTRPVVFYGSSITEGGCATRVGCNYVSLLSNRLNIDVINYGFSGNARGDLRFAEYILKSNPSIFVYDYDHNAPSPAELAATHEPFFRLIREARPDLPIIMMTRPDFGCDDAAERRPIVRRTYENALAAGDRLVRFIDGGTFFPPALVRDCSTDCCHPNDMGFHYMAEAVAPHILDFLEMGYL